MSDLPASDHAIIYAVVHNGEAWAVPHGSQGLFQYGKRAAGRRVAMKGSDGYYAGMEVIATLVVLLALAAGALLWARRIRDR